MAIRKLFISYSHKDGDWVWRTLVPMLRAAGEGSGLKVLIDHERFRLGGSVKGQMDRVQDEAEGTLSVLTPDYIASDYCLHEFDRAVKKGKGWTKHVLLPVVRAGDKGMLPAALGGVLWCDLRNDGVEGPWQLLLRELELEDGLGTSPARWLGTAREVVQVFGAESRSVNLVARTPGVNWRGLFSWFVREQVRDFGEVDLNDPRTGTRPGLFRMILAETTGGGGALPPPPEDVVVFGDHLKAIREKKLAIRHFEHVKARQELYGFDLFTTLRHATERRHLLLLAESRIPASELLPRDHPLSGVDFHTVEL